jgi:hypothetical protein
LEDIVQKGIDPSKVRFPFPGDLAYHHNSRASKLCEPC